MKKLTFGWNEQELLAVEVAKPIRQVSIEFEPHGKPMYVTFWRPDGSGLRVHSEVQEVAERQEIGVLHFTNLKSPSGDELMLPIAPEFDQQNDAFKLVINGPGVRAESGFLLRARNGYEIAVVAAAFPFMIAISGLVERPHIFEPEYPLEEFERIPF